MSARVFAVVVLLSLSFAACAKEISWKSLQPGVELASIVDGASRLYIVRIDPAVATLTVGLASEAGGRAQTAAEWCRTSRLSVAINAGMYQQDHRANVGYLRHGKHLNNPRWNDYRAVIALHPSRPQMPRALWIDLEEASARERVAEYAIVIQNLRLLTTGRKNVWAAGPRRWSEAALAIDTRGRLLFLFARAPHAMHEFNALLLSLPLDIAGAMHLEGGPEASLSIHANGIDMDLSGSYETGFWDDSNRKQWDIPNVLGVVRSR